MNCTLHTCIGDHAQDARLEPSVEGRQRLASINGPGTGHNAVVGASLLQVQSHLQHLQQRGGEIIKFTPTDPPQRSTCLQI